MHKGSPGGGSPPTRQSSALPTMAAIFSAPIADDEACEGAWSENSSPLFGKTFSHRAEFTYSAPTGGNGAVRIFLSADGMGFRNKLLSSRLSQRKQWPAYRHYGFAGE